MLWLPSLTAAVLHHELDVRIEPETHAIEVTDTITWHGGAAALVFALHPGLDPEVVTDGAALVRIEAPSATPDYGGLEPVYYRLETSPGRTAVTLRYGGVIEHGLRQQAGDYARGFRETPGTVSAEGVFLAGSSHWYPEVAGELLTFDLVLRLPRNWSGMTQGERQARDHGPDGVLERWRCDAPQEEIYLVAGAFNEYREAAEGVQAMALLRAPDPALARRYLDATADYLALYADLIGPYPYTKFALVENFWETGYGMPSFTLLGPRVIRFPFILHSSYPHEILHNWWGNGVYVDYGRGNWAEGLTSYLADHLIKEQRGEGAAYRRTVLQKYGDYVQSRRDFALTEFRSRHDAVTEAVGYGKTLMLFHMLRRELGDAAFLDALKALYREYRFRIADFGAVERVFGAAAGRGLAPFFDQWVERIGAPELRVAEASARPEGDAHVLTIGIEQAGSGPAYVLKVPVAVHLEDHAQAHQTELRLDRRHAQFELALPARPLRVDLDPEFDLFRRLHRDEIPPAVSQAAGAERALIVLPGDAPAEHKTGYETLARRWQAERRDGIEIRFDHELAALPADRAVWLFGWRNRFRAELAAALADYDFHDGGDTVRIGDVPLRADAHSVVVLGRHRAHPDQALGWLAADRAAALPGLGRKLPHYGKYSYLAFSGDEPENVLKGQWPVRGSPMSVAVGQHDGATAAPQAGRLAPRAPLAPVRFSAARMRRDIEALADEAMEGRGVDTPGIDRAAAYIAEEFRAAGLEPGGDGGTGWLQVWSEHLPALDRAVSLTNVIGVLPGSDPARAGESVVIGAHYDHLGRGEFIFRSEDRGRIHPGADDNASGVAVMLELARALAGSALPRAVVFAAFTGEEVGWLGSRHYLRHASRYPPGQIVAMISLDAVGRLGNRPLGVLGTGTAEEWSHILAGAGHQAGLTIAPVREDIGSSDHTSFIEAGVPAVQLSSGAHEDFHRPGDTPDKIDGAGLVAVGQLLREMTAHLAARSERLRSAPGAARETAAPAAARRVGLGLVPAYAYDGDGVQIADVRAGSPAVEAGLRPGDVIVAVNGIPVRGLREYTDVLRALSPGDEVRIDVLREGAKRSVKARVAGR